MSQIENFKNISVKYRFIIFAVILFFAVIFLISFFWTASQKELLKKENFRKKNFYKEKREIVEKNSFREIMERVQIILQRNLQVFILLLLGIFTIGFQSLLQLGWIAWSMGCDIAFLSSQDVSSRFILAFTLPHGIFELLGFFTTGSLGLRSAFLFAKYLFSKDYKIDFKNEIRSMETLFVVSLFLIVSAVYIESFITPQFAKLFFED